MTAQPLEATEKKNGKKAKAPKPPKPPKVKKPRQPWGMAPWLALFGILLAGAAVAVMLYPIPGLTAKPVPKAGADQAAGKTPGAAAGAPAQQAADLAQKEAELAAREEAVAQKEAEIASLVKDLGVTEPEPTALRRAARMYAAMPPYKAGPLIQELPTGTAVQIFRLMTEEQAAVIIGYMEAEQAAEIMTELARPATPNQAGG